MLVVISIVLTVLLAARHLYRSPYSASDLRVTPDEVEYAVCAKRIATLGRYDLELDGVSTPPHSTPWFSALLAPVYLVAPSDVGNGIVLVFAIAIVGVLVVQRLGTIVVGSLGGTFAVLALLALPAYPYTARLIMTDCPATVLALVGLWLFLRSSGRAWRMRESFAAGVLVACAFALRSPYLSMLAPFMWRAWRTARASDESRASRASSERRAGCAPDERREDRAPGETRAKRGERRWRNLAALIAPLVVVLVANGAYNEIAFGDWRRTGYQFWCAVPYDYPDLVLSIAYVRDNFASFWIPANQAAIALGACGAIALVVRRPALWREFLGYAAITALPISALHFAYFYPSSRFHVYLLASCAVIGGIGIASLVPAAVRERRSSQLAAVASLAIALFALKPFNMPEPSRRLTADAIAAATPDDAVIISGLEPVYLAAVAPERSHRTYLAASRDVEFASKVLMKERIDRALASPIDARDHAALGLLEHGGRWALAHTADEMHGSIEAWVRAGRPVFLESAFISNATSVQRILGSSLRLADPRASLSRIVAAN